MCVHTEFLKIAIIVFYYLYPNIVLDDFSCCRGISSTVRRCIEKETGIEYAAKIIDISNEPHESTEGHTMKDATLQEVHILRRVAGHPYISKIL